MGCRRLTALRRTTDAYHSPVRFLAHRVALRQRRRHGPTHRYPLGGRGHPGYGCRTGTDRPTRAEQRICGYGAAHGPDRDARTRRDRHRRRPERPRDAVGRPAGHHPRVVRPPRLLHSRRGDRRLGARVRADHDRCTRHWRRVGLSRRPVRRGRQVFRRRSRLGDRCQVGDHRLWTAREERDDEHCARGPLHGQHGQHAHEQYGQHAHE